MGNGSGLEVLKNGEDNFKLALGTKVIDGAYGTIFEASNGDLYAMGNGSKLEVLKNGEDSLKLALGSKIIDGKGGTIFQTSNGDLYAMGNGTGLEVLKNGEDSFKSAPGTMITNGRHGTIFKASNDDLYAMGWESGLEVLKKGEKSFKSAPGTRITNGAHGTIFEAKNGDLYAMGYKSKLEVLKNGEDSFEIAQGSQITNGWWGTIFEASNNDIYTMGVGSGGLEVLKNGDDNFKSVLETNIKDGSYGKIFEASNGDLYAMGNNSKLEVLKNGDDDFKSVLGAKVIDGAYGTIFEASNGDLYAMGNGSGLEVLKMGDDKFKSVPWTKITNGNGGTIFETKNGDLYAMAKDSSLQVLLKNNKNKLEFKTTRETLKGQNDGIIEVENIINKYSKLQYKLNSASAWTDVPPRGEINSLAPGTYNFQWVGKVGETYHGSANTSIRLNDQTISNGVKISLPTLTPVFSKTNATAKGVGDGTIIIKDFNEYYSKLQYKLSSSATWTDVPPSGQINSLAPDTYNFQWVGKKGEQYEGEPNTSIQLTNQIIKNSIKISLPTLTPVFSKTNATAKGAGDGTIIIKDFNEYYSKLQYKLSSSATWTDVPPSGQINSLAPGTYNFQWVGKKGETYINEKLAINLLPNQIVQVPKTSSNNLAIILGTTIPASLISIGVITWWVWHFFFKTQKTKNPKK